MGYSGQFDPEKMSRAYGKELHISPKHSVEICNAIRGLHVLGAKNLLQAVIEMKEPITMRRYKMAVSHKKRSKGPGRYPVKASKEILRVIESAQANAEKGGMESEEMRISTAAAYRGRHIKGFMPRAHGRWEKWDEETTNVEIILVSLEE